VEKQYKTKVVTIDKDMFRVFSKEFLQQYARPIEHTYTVWYITNSFTAQP